MLLAIDPGNAESAYVVIDDKCRPVNFGKLRNQDLLTHIGSIAHEVETAAIEMVASYGMAVGADIFDTCVWIGRFYQVLVGPISSVPTRLIKRLQIKTHHCHSAKANDANIRQALIDRFAPGERNYGKGTQKEPGWFFGFHSDVWAAYALAVYVADVATDRGSR